MAREYLRITPETGGNPTLWGQFQAGNLSSATIVQLTDSNAFTMRPTPIRWTIRSAGGYNRRIQSGSSKTVLNGALNNLVLYGSQVAAWINWIQPYQIGGTGEYDVNSCTVDHALVMEDGSNTTIYRRYLGVKVGGWQITSNSDSQLLRISLTGLVGKSTASITSSDFSEPTYSSYPSDTPFVHEHAATATMGGTSRVVTGFDQFQVTGRNLLDPRFFNSTTIAYLKYCGRDIDWSIQFPYVVSTDRTSLFEGTTPSAFSVAYSIPASHTLTLNFENQNILGGIGDSLDFNQLFMQTVSGWSQVDSGAGNDFVPTST